MKRADYLLELANHLRNFAGGSEEPINIVFHGHSIPCGYTVNRVVRSGDSYPQLVKDGLNVRYPNAVLNTIVTGIGGEAAVSGVNRMDTVLHHRPELVVIDYGRNDVFAPIDSTKEAWKRMVEVLLEAGVKVLLVTPAVDSGQLYYDPSKRTVSDEEEAEMIRNIADEYKVGCADVYATFEKMLNCGYQKSDFMAGVNHPNRSGHEVIAREILRWFPNAV